jgi:dipeptidyl aminopeptidase/acylaminoacyl peptidase
MTHAPPLPSIAPEDLFRLRFVQNGRLSPDAAAVAYSVSFTDPANDADRAAIWLQAIATGERRQLTDGAAYDTNPQWSPNGKTLAFRSNRDGRMQIYLLPAGSGGSEARQLTYLPQGVGDDFAWSPDGRWIAFSAGPTRPAFDPNRPYRITRAMYRLDGMGYVDNAIHDLYAIAADGGEPIQLTHDACHNTRPVWSPDGKQILYETTLFPNSYRFFPALRLVGFDDGWVGEMRPLVEAWGFARAAAWLPDGSGVAFIGNRHVPFGTPNHLWVVRRDNGGEPECRTAAIPYDVGKELQPDMPCLELGEPLLHITADGRFAFMRVSTGGHMRTFRVALAGPESWEAVLPERERSDLPLDLQAGRLLMAISTMHEPTDLIVSDLDGRDEQRLTGVNAGFLAGRALPVVERLQFASPDGQTVEGWFMRPAAGEAPFPTILLIHGGPHQGWGHIYGFDAQMLAGAGYGVLLINYRGSAGYGGSFSTQINGNLGELEYADLMTGVDYAIALGLADPDRLGVCGLSYGGFMSCWIAGHTDRFRAAVPENPISNRISWYGVADMGLSHVESVGGHLHEIPERYWACSPITYAHRCTTPTLLIQSEHDWRCPAEQSEQFYTILKSHGCAVEMLRLPHMPHMASAGGPPTIRRAQNEALLDWMQRYV